MIVSTGCRCPDADIGVWGAMRAEYRCRDDLFYCLECGDPIKPKTIAEVDHAWSNEGKLHPRGTMTDGEFAAWLGGPFTRARYFVPVEARPEDESETLVRERDLAQERPESPSDRFNRRVREAAGRDRGCGLGL